MADQNQLALDLWASLDVEINPPGAIDHKQAVPIIQRWMIEHAEELREALTNTPTADIVASGPVNGMGEPDKSGPYVQLTISTRTTEQRLRVSFGAAEVLAAELLGVIGMGELVVAT